MGGRASSASKNAWNAKTYDRINLTVPKGQKETIQAHAAAHGESVNGFINRAIAEAIEASENPFILAEKITHCMGGKDYDVYYRERIDENIEPDKDKADTDTPME